MKILHKNFIKIILQYFVLTGKRTVCFGVNDSVLWAIIFLNMI